MQRIALISDVHGNVLALREVERDFLALGVDAVVNLGDCVSGPLWPRETLELLMTRDWATVRGNHDRQVATLPVETQGPSDSFAWRELSPDQRSWLGSLPPTLDVHGLLACHGSPRSDDEFLLEETQGGRKVLRPRADIEARIGVPALVVCGHSHLPRCVRRESGALVVNPGSVGLQAFAEGEGEPYRVETGSPHARYAVLENRAGRWTPFFRLVEYDGEAAAARAAVSGRFDWQSALATGFCPAER